MLSHACGSGSTPLARWALGGFDQRVDRRGFCGRAVSRYDVHMQNKKTVATICSMAVALAVAIAEAVFRVFSGGRICPDEAGEVVDTGGDADE